MIGKDMMAPALNHNSFIFNASQNEALINQNFETSKMIFKKYRLS